MLWLFCPVLSEQHQFANVSNPPFDDRRLSVIFLQNNNEMLSFAKSFTFKVEGMCLQHLPTLSLKGNEPDGLQIEEKLHARSGKNTERKRCPFCHFVLDDLVLSLLSLKCPFCPVLWLFCPVLCSFCPSHKRLKFAGTVLLFFFVETSNC